MSKWDGVKQIGDTGCEPVSSSQIDAGYDFEWDVTFAGQSRTTITYTYLPDPGGWRGWLMRKLAR